jgi:nicotinate-nucleotide adenylyltransferase
MLIEALSDLEWTDFSDCEIKRKGISYTADTLEYIEENYSITGKPGLIIGDDLAVGFSSWRNPDKIVHMSDLIIAHRLSKDRIPLKFPHRYIDNDIFSLSSSEIREMVRDGLDISDYVPEKVFHYIKEKGLYIGEVKGN